MAKKKKWKNTHVHLLAQCAYTALLVLWCLLMPWHITWGDTFVKCHCYATCWKTTSSKKNLLTGNTCKKYTHTHIQPAVLPLYVSQQKGFMKKNFTGRLKRLVPCVTNLHRTSQPDASSLSLGSSFSFSNLSSGNFPSTLIAAGPLSRQASECVRARLGPR